MKPKDGTRYTLYYKLQTNIEFNSVSVANSNKDHEKTSETNK